MTKPIKAVLLFGRFNPPTKGHSKLVRGMIQLADNRHCYLSTSQTNDHVKNPLPYHVKIDILSRLYPYINVIGNPAIKSVRDAIKYLISLNYPQIELIVGEDRHEAFTGLASHYGILLHKGLSRDDGISATLLRQLALEGDFGGFGALLDTVDFNLIEYIYNETRKGLLDGNKS